MDGRGKLICLKSNMKIQLHYSLFAYSCLEQKNAYSLYQYGCRIRYQKEGLILLCHQRNHLAYIFPKSFILKKQVYAKQINWGQEGKQSSSDGSIWLNYTLMTWPNLFRMCSNLGFFHPNFPAFLISLGTEVECSLMVLQGFPTPHFIFPLKYLHV